MNSLETHWTIQGKNVKSGIDHTIACITLYLNFRQSASFQKSSEGLVKTMILLPFRREVRIVQKRIPVAISAVQTYSAYYISSKGGESMVQPDDSVLAFHIPQSLFQSLCHLGEHRLQARNTHAREEWLKWFSSQPMQIMVYRTKMGPWRTLPLSLCKIAVVWDAIARTDGPATHRRNLDQDRRHHNFLFFAYSVQHTLHCRILDHVWTAHQD